MDASFDNKFDICILQEQLLQLLQCMHTDRKEQANINSDFYCNFTHVAITVSQI